MHCSKPESLTHKVEVILSGLQTLKASHPQSLWLHLEVGLHLVGGKGPYCRQQVFVIFSHPAPERETTVCNRVGFKHALYTVGMS